jgi:cytochrome bd-type quinol oxidase subunit 2
MSRDHDYEESPREDLKRYAKRAWLVLSACWVSFVFLAMLIEPNVARLFTVRPLRVLGATIGMMFAPPVIVYAAGVAVWFTAKWIRRRISARPRGEQ